MVCLLGNVMNIRHKELDFRELRVNEKELDVNSTNVKWPLYQLVAFEHVYESKSYIFFNPFTGCKAVKPL